MSAAVGDRLLRFARESIAHALGAAAPDAPSGEPFESQRATFVTLRRFGRLHGCIGTIEARRSLGDDVRKNAVAAALRDPRASPLDLPSVRQLEVEISLLSPLEGVSVDGERAAALALRPGIDGVVLRAHGRQATFLPQVWESLPEPALFLAELRRKAGLSGDAWPADAELLRYTLEQKWRAEAEIEPI